MLAAVMSGNAKKVAEMIRQDPGFKVNMDQDGSGGTLLHHACWEDRSALDVNVKDTFGQTPFYLACGRSPSRVRELLKDSRVNVNEPAYNGWTPLWRAACNGHLDIIKWWIASGREMDLGKPGDVDKTDAIGGAKKNGKTGVVTLLERFKSDASKTRSKVRMELGINGQYYSDYYSPSYSYSYSRPFFILSLWASPFFTPAKYDLSPFSSLSL